jgi:hypothetical protein
MTPAAESSLEYCMTQAQQSSGKPFYESYNLTPLGPDTIHKILDTSLDKSIVYCIIGEAGIGKTEISEQIAHSKGLGHIAVYVSLCQTEDLAGIPRDTGKGTYSYLAPERIVAAIRANPEGGILALEEINRMVDSSVGGAIFAIISERRIGDFKIPDNWAVLATMNPHSGNYAVSDISRDAAWIRRLCFLAMVHNTRDWLTWAKKSGIHKSVISYIISNPDNLLDEATRSTNTAYANPAGWAKVSKMMHIWDKSAVGDGVKRHVLTGIIGKAVANAFLAFVNKEVVNIPPEDILREFSNKSSEVYTMTMELMENNKKEVVAKSALSLASYLITEKPELAQDTVNNIVKFIKVLEEDSIMAFFNEIIGAMGQKDSPAENSKWYRNFSVMLSRMKEFSEITKHIIKLNDSINSAWKDSEK